MLKGIVIFFKILIVGRPKPNSSFAQRFGNDCTHADQNQWNGGRHLSFKELRASNYHNTMGTKELEKHVS